ncbi:MAG: homoserine dehydrogenase [Clostridiales bacterium]|nr:homoserine dehydrogenase [Clostridiales bacterium]
MAKVAIMGYGTVGSGVYEIIAQNSEKLCKNTNGTAVEVKYILDIRDFDDHPHKELFTKDFNDILNDPQVSVVAEVMGGLHPAYEFTKSLLEAGKSVVTSNKELVATYGTELLDTAVKNHVNYMFEASVGGGIPVIRPLHQDLTANHITKIAGILNGTTNYILNEMINNGSTFEDALKDAQEKGYAERNPAADIEGHDACRKIAILASLASGYEVDYSGIETEGIVNITLDDVKCADKFGGRIKLIGYAEFLENGRIYSLVSPMFIPDECPLAGVNDVFNAIMVTGDCVGDLMFYGAGAGKLPTASAVVADVVDCVKHEKSPKKILWVKPQKELMADENDKQFAYFVRACDSEENIKKIFADAKIKPGAADGEMMFITKPMMAEEISRKLNELQKTVTAIKVLG